MVYQLREEGGKKSAFSSGTFVPKGGVPQSLSAGDFSIEVLDRWKSPRSGVSYPSQWKISVPKLSISLRVTPTVKDQELKTTGSTRITYWEGRSAVEPESPGAGVKGDAYVELVGY